MNLPDPLPSQPDGDAPVFAEPWQARAFAMTVLLHRQGIFDWAEWSAALAKQCAHAGGAEFYGAWLRALETLLETRGVTPERVAVLTESWQRAAHATPHGQPIRLENAGGR